MIVEKTDVSKIIKAVFEVNPVANADEDGEISSCNVAGVKVNPYATLDYDFSIERMLAVMHLSPVLGSGVTVVNDRSVEPREDDNEVLQRSLERSEQAESGFRVDEVDQVEDTVEEIIVLVVIIRDRVVMMATQSGIISPFVVSYHL